MSKSNLTRVDGVRVSSTPPPRHRRGGAQRQRDTIATRAERGKNNSQNTGDPACANGWAFSSDHLPGGARPDHATDITKIERWFAEAGADVFACAHTCRPVLQKFESGLVANNGAAGLGNFRGDPRGLVTRVACADVESALGAPLYSADLGRARVEAVPLDFDLNAALRRVRRGLGPRERRGRVVPRAARAR